MSKPTIVLLSGWKGSGKDTVADHLIKEYSFKRLAFADPLKDMAAKLFNVKRHLFDDRILKEQPIMYMPVQAKDGFSKNVTEFMAKEFKPSGVRGEFELYWSPRALAILLGSTMRAVNPNFWIEKALAQADPNGRYVITDCRYKNEIEVVKAASENTIAVRVNRFDTTESVDPSERDLDDYKFELVIDNKGTLDELREWTKAVASLVIV